MAKNKSCNHQCTSDIDIIYLKFNAIKNSRPIATHQSFDFDHFLSCCIIDKLLACRTQKITRVRKIESVPQFPHRNNTKHYILVTRSHTLRFNYTALSLCLARTYQIRSRS